MPCRRLLKSLLAYTFFMVSSFPVVPRRKSRRPPLLLSDALEGPCPSPPLFQCYCSAGRDVFSVFRRRGLATFGGHGLLEFECVDLAPLPLFAELTLPRAFFPEVEAFLSLSDLVNTSLFAGVPPPSTPSPPILSS